MTLTQLIAMPVWTLAGAILLFFLMWIDSMFTKYKDIAEIKNGNVAVTTRFVMKLFAQGYILSQSITISWSLWQALLTSVVSFVILLIVQKMIEFILKSWMDLDLEQGTQDGKLAYALFAGSLHLTGALILAACL